MTIVEPRRIGVLPVPSGLLAVSGPDLDHRDGPHITVPIPPGEYQFDEAGARSTYHCEWEGRQVTVTDPLAVRVLVDDSPTETWEMALRPGEDPRLLLDNGISGFDTDGATGCFADAGAWDPLITAYRSKLTRPGTGRGTDPDPGVREAMSGSMFHDVVQDPASGGGLAAFATSGDGTHPVWVGRSGAGQVTGVVVLVEPGFALLPESEGGAGA
ncbi:DUF4241 domain-containing protein [Streptomyces sp. NPDC093252]|uniref:DUF4241 domain-containing protein n=1 Tax=Streptomyces sp. NPDC093252 TaxID=3154980 RepID=UPI00342E36C1